MAASTALPGLYRPVRIQGRDYVDGGVRKTAHINLAIQSGATLVICINPIVPYLNDTSKGALAGHLSNRGVTWVLDQAMRIVLHGRMSYGMERYAREHPGVDILLPAPDGDYQLTSGTSFSAAYVSGVAALILQRAPGLKPDGVRKILEQTAKDLGPIGKDPEYGAGLVDAYQAILAVQSPAASATGQGGPQPKMTAQ